MYIIDALPENRDYLCLQRLYPVERLLSDRDLEQMQERELLSTHYLMSVFFERHFKETLDQYLSKALVCG